MIRKKQLFKGGIEETGAYEIEENLEITTKYKLPDIITYLQNETNLTRKSIVNILTNSKTLDSLRKIRNLIQNKLQI